VACLNVCVNINSSFLRPGTTRLSASRVGGGGATHAPSGLTNSVRAIWNDQIPRPCIPPNPFIDFLSFLNIPRDRPEAKDSHFSSELGATRRKLGPADRQGRIMLSGVRQISSATPANLFSPSCAVSMRWGAKAQPPCLSIVVRALLRVFLVSPVGTFGSRQLYIDRGAKISRRPPWDSVPCGAYTFSSAAPFRPSLWLRQWSGSPMGKKNFFNSSAPLVWCVQGWPRSMPGLPPSNLAGITPCLHFSVVD